VIAGYRKIKRYTGVESGGAESKLTPKSFDLSKIWAKFKKHWANKLQFCLTLLVKLYFVGIECVNKSLLCHIENTLNNYKLSKL